MKFFKGNPEKDLKKAEEKQRKALMELQKKKLRMKAILSEKARKEKIKLEKETEKKRLKEEKQKSKVNVIAGMGFNEMRDFVNRFPQTPDSDLNPKEFNETVDLHLQNLDTMMHVNPKGYPGDEITWNEPHDTQAYWLQQEPKLWLIVFLIMCFFGSIYFTYMWYL